MFLYTEVLKLNEAASAVPSYHTAHLHFFISQVNFRENTNKIFADIFKPKKCAKSFFSCGIYLYCIQYKKCLTPKVKQERSVEVDRGFDWYPPLTVSVFLFI